MKNYIILLVFGLISLQGFSQNYSYSFNGEVSFDDIKKIEDRVAALPEVNSAKVRYKEDSQKGEILIHIVPSSERVESRVTFKASELKQILQSYGLTPSQFVELKAK